MKAQKYRLEGGAIHATRLARAPVVVRCAQGPLWVTLESEPRDFVLASGESLVVQGPGRLVVVAVDGGSFELGPAPRVTQLAA